MSNPPTGTLAMCPDCWGHLYRATTIGLPVYRCIRHGCLGQADASRVPAGTYAEDDMGRLVIAHPITRQE